MSHIQKNAAGQVLVLPDLTVLGSITKASELAGVPGKSIRSTTLQ